MMNVLIWNFCLDTYIFCFKLRKNILYRQLLDLIVTFQCTCIFFQLTDYHMFEEIKQQGARDFYPIISLNDELNLVIRLYLWLFTSHSQRRYIIFNSVYLKLYYLFIIRIKICFFKCVYDVFYTWLELSHQNGNDKLQYENVLVYQTA